ncbi:MAG TPA: ATP phosphoribosyltransferase regulatory subunit [Vicinamibacteria bacterium]
MNGAHRLTQVPPGVQCFVGEEARRRRQIEERVLRVFEGWDYEEIIPPLFDYADVFADGALGPRTYSFVGRDGSLLALRPDFTSLLAKIAAGRLKERPAPIRLYYSGEVLRYEPPRAGSQSELFQMGLEHLGGEALRADTEVLAVAAECLDALGIGGFLLTLGHVGIFSGLAEAAGLSGAALAPIRERVESKDAAGVAEALRRAGASGPAADSLVRLATLAGGADVLGEVKRVAAPSQAAALAARDLEGVVSTLHEAGLGDRVVLDLGEVRGLDYYTGLVFRVLAPGLGFEVGSGGRYDTLVGRFGRALPAVGFMLGLDRLDLLMQRQGVALDQAPAEPVLVTAPDVGRSLRAARGLRGEGTRVRFCPDEDGGGA